MYFLLVSAHSETAVSGWKPVKLQILPYSFFFEGIIISPISPGETWGFFEEVQ